VTGPTPATPIDAAPSEIVDRLDTTPVALPEGFVEQLEGAGAVVDTDDLARAEAGRDWWPLAVGWAAEGSVPRRPGAVVRTHTTAQVAGVLATCRSAGVPVTVAGGRSGVCGGAVPAFGGIALDLTRDTGVVEVDETSLLADVRAGTFGPDLEAHLGRTGAGYTLGHWPQSMDLSTLGGWLACRSAGQYSTRYGKIEDMVVGLEVVLADGAIVRTDGHGPRASTGPSLTQLLVGSEGTLGVITEARLRIHPRPGGRERGAYGFAAFSEGLDVCRRVLRRGATPAVLRLYDRTESERHFDLPDLNVLVVLDEADPALVAATMGIVDAECRAAPGVQVLETDLVDRWLGHRNDVSPLAPLWRAGFVVDTVEVAGRWSVLPALYDATVRALQDLDGTVAVSAHQSHAYTDGACLYFTFGGHRPDGVGAWREGYYRRAWDAVVGCALDHGAAISHHHGVGLQRARFMTQALGNAAAVLADVKAALDPTGILNPGKLGLRSPFGPTPWP
jgi:alkyldihydroxyacetonephosphate synthase